MRTSIATCPGKVLLCGGYLVLDQKYCGLVISTTARFKTEIKSLANLSSHTIQVHSPQFTDGIWNYNGQIVENEECEPIFELTSISDTQNSYVEITLKHTLNILLYILTPRLFELVLKDGLDITILGDNDFYSQKKHFEEKGLDVSFTSLKSLPQYMPTNEKISKVCKTGLGSSAAMITSLVAALYTYFTSHDSKPVHEDEKNREIIHAISQFCHCVAQGKIGSGFDVACAVYASHRYTRFSPNLLEKYMNVPCNTPSALYEMTQQRWDHQIVQFTLPKGMVMILGDVNGGSASPGMASKVNKWKSQNEEASDKLFGEIYKLNMIVYDGLRRLGEMHDTVMYHETLQLFSTKTADQWDLDNNVVSETLIRIYSSFQIVRTLLRTLSDLTSVPIEPKEQTELLDLTMLNPGVLFAGVPGAGGYDAIFCIALNENCAKVVHTTWEAKEIVPLITQSGLNGLVTWTEEDI